MNRAKRIVPFVAFSLLLLVNVAAPTMAFSTNSPLLPDAHLPLRYIAPQQGHQGGGGNGGGKGGGGGSGGGSSSCTSTMPGAIGVAYTPSQIKTAYDYGTSTGAGETIAIIDAYGSSTLTSDVACFDSTFGLSASQLSIVTPFGKVHGSNSNWGLETTLDVEWAQAMAPAANILLIITPSASLSYLINDAVPYAVSQGANVISMSWGSYENQLSCSTLAQESAYFASATSAGAIPVAASGDNGAYNGNTLSVLYPASDPNVVSTGGTSLTTSSGQYSGEVVWDTSSTEATGGGVSSCFAEPSYQSNAGVTVSTVSGPQSVTGRVVPDVSYNADPYTGYWVFDTNGFTGWVQVGGTSAAAPQWSAIMADAKSAGASISGTSIHEQIYSLLGSSSVHDITQGNNNYYIATSGYDATTGVGTPVEISVVAAW